MHYWCRQVVFATSASLVNVIKMYRLKCDDLTSLIKSKRRYSRPETDKMDRPEKTAAQEAMHRTPCSLSHVLDDKSKPSRNI